MQAPHLRATLALLLTAACPGAWAQSQDPLTLTAAFSVQTDSNLFRLPAQAQTQAAIGRADASEQIRSSTLGFDFRTQQSLQQLELTAHVVDYQYQNFHYLNYTATNFNAAWRWSVTPRWYGNLTATRSETLNNYANFQGYSQRNLHLDTTAGIDAEYEIDGPWHLVAALSSGRQSNQVAQVTGNEFSYAAVDTGLRYVFASGSNITYRMRTNQGEYLQGVDNPYQQIDQDLRLHWVASGHSTLDANLTYIRRSHPQSAQLDYGGFNTGVHLNWLLSGKTSLSVAYQHTLDAYETASSNYTQTDAFTWSPAWQISPKTTLRWQSSFDQVQYLGSPTAGASSARRDTNRSNTLSLSWQPHPKLNISSSIGTLSRGSNQADFDYEARVLSLSAQLSY